jgi:phosphoadenosine phosphosulfate reductase
MNEQKQAQAIELLQHIAWNYAPAVFANSLGAEDMVVMNMIAQHAPEIEVFTLDTGMLPEETHALLGKIRDTYSIPVRVYHPEPAEVEAYVNEYGAEAFYNSVDLRKRCCHIRKIEPLKHALHGKRAWVTGLRRSQSTTRTEAEVSEWDSTFGLQKFNPLADWSEEEIWSYIRFHGVPYNALHDRHYPSIGCAPCTRAITVGEDIRSGRWWWENPETKECGLHVRTIT